MLRTYPEKNLRDKLKNKKVRAAPVTQGHAKSQYRENRPLNVYIHIK